MCVDVDDDSKERYFVKLDNLLKAFHALRGKKHDWTCLNVNPSPVEASRRLYVVVRDDLLPGLQISQSIHAKDEFTHAFPETEMAWRKTSNTIIILSTNAFELEGIIRNADILGIKHSVFMEPDLYGQVTAVALEPGNLTVGIVSNFPLALKDLA
jgi:hypothetical protein